MLEATGRKPTVRQIYALAWIHGLAGLFPFLRPSSAQCLAFAERVARELGPADSDVPAERVEECLHLLGAAAQIGLVEAFVTRHPEQWTSVCRDLGDDALARRVLAAGAVRAAIDDRRLPPRRLLDDLEAGVAPTRPPQAALSLALRPNGIWSIEKAEVAVASLAVYVAHFHAIPRSVS